ncbi:MAG: nucleotide sugar dehydrogenase [Planctomycetes bacterium]|nr:nucleotide sugar dehydrogenase [Planctomycetota bacterium]MCB9918105.1 nucleotide sugar dehydrogenase [Planctomycetota bacterium]
MTPQSPRAAEDRIAIIGLGYVGLPLAAAFAEAGLEVVGVDVSEFKVETIRAGKSVTPDVPHEDVKRFVEAGLLSATTDFAAVAGVGLISICVPTPLGKSKDPDISYIVKACDALVPHVSKGTTLVLESTTYPGTTREIILPRFEAAGFEIGKDLFLAFSPERIDPGNPTWNVQNTPKVVGGLTPECSERAAAFYARALETIVPVRDAETAELAKLLENTFRSINIGLVNELAIACRRLGISVFEVIDAAATKPFGFMPFRPGPGLGGHCLPIDPLYLSWKMRTLDYKVRFIELADEVNSAMPGYVVARCAEVLNERSKSVKGSHVLLLGMAYKKDIDDMRESPALDVFDELEKRGARVSYFDPYVPKFSHEGKSFTGVDEAEALSGAFDLVVITTDHKVFDYERFVGRGIPILDTRNALGQRDETHVHSL